MYSHSRASANLSPIIQSSDHHSAPSNDYAMPPPPSPPRRSPTAAPPPLMTKKQLAPKRSTSQMKPLPIVDAGPTGYSARKREDLV